MFITTDSKTFYIRLYHQKQMRQRGPQIGTPFKDGILSHTPVARSPSNPCTPSLRSVTFGAPSLHSVAFGAPLLRSVAIGAPLLCSVAFGAPLLRSVAFGAPSLCSVAFGTPSLRSVACHPMVPIHSCVEPHCSYHHI